MEGLARLVSESLARHGFETTLDHHRLQWSQWFRCESSFSLLLVPGKPGLFALAEEVVAPGEIPAAGSKRMLALFRIAEADDLAVALGRLFLPASPERERLASGRCFARYVAIEDAVQRKTAYAAFQQWLATSSEAASGIVGTLQSAPFMGGSSQAVEIEGGEHHREVEPPAPLPDGF
ncbi:MAG TPA: hypothetical protein VMT28_13900 [Terriglobales bacterium]|jgi:hypothetical protein|nr:hypothetical protein [Terriglobales bacterium]